MVKEQTAPARETSARERYNEPLLLKHEPLRDITGQKYGEKAGQEKTPDG